MKTTMKMLLLATAMMATTPAFANDMNNADAPKVPSDAKRMPMKKHRTNHDYNQQRSMDESYSTTTDSNAMNWRDENGVWHSRRDREISRNSEDCYNGTWMGMRATKCGVKSGSDNDVNSRNEHPYTFATGHNNPNDWRLNGMSRVVKH